MDYYAKRQWKEFILVCIIVALIFGCYAAFGAETDDDLLMEPPSFGNNEWVFIKADQFSNKFSYEKSTLKIENGKISVWIREDPYVAVPIKGTGKIFAQLWRIDCKNKFAMSIQRWTIDSSNYAWEPHRVNNEKQTLNPRTPMWDMCLIYGDKI
jgi:hypothetical protein